MLPLFSDVAGNQPTVRVAGGQSGKGGNGGSFHLVTLIATNEPNLHATFARADSWPCLRFIDTGEEEKICRSVLFNLCLPRFSTYSVLVLT